MPITITRNPNLAKSQKPVFIENEVKKNFNEIYKTNWWTGIPPQECPGFDKDRNVLVSLPLINLDICSRQDALDAFNNVWTTTELLFQSLKTEQTFVRPPYHGLRHPMMFYYGHTAVVYYNKMRLAGIFKEPLNLYLEKILETGVDEMSWDDMSKNEMAWPKLIEVHAYRKAVYDLIVQLITTHSDFDLPREKRSFLQDSPWWALWMGMEHEKIHIETSSVLIRELPIELVEHPEFFPPLHPSRNETATINNEWLEAHGTTVKIGKPLSEPSYGWDNEYGERIVKIKDFHYTKHQITNREFYDFVASGSYVQDRYWSEEGVHWRKFRNTKRPTFWCGVGPEGSHDYGLRTLFEIIPMPWNFPCEVNFHEAMAYANWKKEADQKNYRLLTEAEFISLRKNQCDPVLQTKPYSAYQKFDENFSANFNLQWSSPRNVDSELYGNVWHWMMDQFNPLNNFKVHFLYDDFSTPCFDGKHQMILGGSFISCGDEASHWSRFHFRPHFYQHAGFRMAYTDDGSLDNGATKLSVSTEYVHPRRLNVLDQMQKIDWWKQIDQPLELTEEELKNIYEITIKTLIHFNRDFDKMSPMGSAHDPSQNKLKENFSLPYIQTKDFPMNPSNYDALLKTVFEELAPTGMMPGHPGFAAYVAGCANSISNIAQMISGTLNPFSGHFMMAPGLVTLEEEAIKWFINLFQLDETRSFGYFTTGSSLAALHAISIARQKKIKGHDFSKITGYVSEEGHHSISKNWAILGFPKDNLRKIPTATFKMNSALLQKKIESDIEDGMVPFLVVTTVGTTKTGSIDPINEINLIAQKFNLWHHIDGAYGAPFILTQKGKEKLKGIELCDSLTLDLHKAFSLPYGTGLLLIQNAQDMFVQYSSDDTYMPPRPDDHFDFADISPELSRDYRGLRVWLPLKTLGIGPFILNLEEKLMLSQYTHERLNKVKELIITSGPELTIQTFRHAKGDLATSELLTQINNDQTLFLSSATVEGKMVIRICLLGFKMHFEYLEKGLNRLIEIARAI